ncbi:MAG: hypothetical protein KA257_01090 [Opitutaceae bacterium]|nr:hypothetical protein [Opitutaceae bacterium]MBP9912115.1 hypothetical protein [Opitutaceae bacterium]
MHVATYSSELPRAVLNGTWGVTVLLCIPLVMLFARVKKEPSPEPVWQRFWNSMIERCPPWIWRLMGITWLLTMFVFVLGILGLKYSPVLFHTALVLMPISAALSYSVTLIRK